MEKIVIIGGGASGLVSALFSKNKNNEVIILERNNDCGKKLLVTGNGRCNYFNSDQSIKHYHSNSPELVKEFINTKNIYKVLTFFNELGIIPKIKDGYYYPFSNQATTIKNTLVDEVIKSGVIIKNNFLVTDITKENNKFIINSENEEVIADKLVIATGSYSAPKTGSDGMGYSFLEKFGHKIEKVLPSLVGVKTSGNYLKDWTGVRSEVKLSLYEDDKLIREESGEAQFTKYGLSGICTFNLSEYIARGLYNNKKEVIKINFIPFLDYKENNEYNNWLTTETNKLNISISKLLERILNYKLVNIIIKESNISKDKLYTELTNKEQDKLISNLVSFELNITETNSYEESQVCSGGVSLEEINLSTMESKLVSNLYITGELLDIVGDCGGYNLTISWLSGILVGGSINND
ncbi:MAG: aminoacetone oxidase family FAD-binding enzyme [Firmicutes bacterium]|nr:aminoacetone oxidase family FAD-binding enzyme [Bacillota bacterium]